MKKYLLTIVTLLMSYTSFAQVQVSNLVTPVTYFVNHIRQLTLLKDNLAKYKQASIVGISGMGKTQLARMYSYENKNNYDLIWFFDCNLDINEEFLKLAKSINTTTKSNLISEDVLSAKKEIMTYLSSKDKWLLVFDNLKVKENQKISNFVTWEHNGNVIFCSQDSEILPNIVRMTAFEKSDAINLANNILENKDHKLAEFLAQEFVGYPILIVQGAQLLNQVPGLDKEEYKRRVGQSTDKIKLNITLAINELKLGTKKLLNKIALINNQGFSKDLLRIVADDRNTIDDDIYQLSKFALISNIDSNETNPIFEMHDVIAQKIAEINEESSNKTYLEEIVTMLMSHVPKSVVKARIFRSAKTISENIEIILKNSEKYSTSVYKLIELNLQLLVQHNNSLNYYNAKKQVDWFNKNDQVGNFKLWLMNNDEKRVYASYLQSIGGYYRNCSRYELAIKYYTQAKKVFDKVVGYESLKWNAYICLAMSNIALGQIQDAEKDMQIIEQMFNEGIVDKGDIGFIYGCKARLLFVQGKYNESLEQTNKAIEVCIKNGLHPDDLFLINPYILKAEILNVLGKYNEAFAQVSQLYNMCKPSKKEDHEIFGRIFTQMARAELGLRKINEALEHVQKAITIYTNDKARHNVDITKSTDPLLAKAFVVKADVLVALGKNEQAVESYALAEVIYYNLYRQNIKNVDEVSYLYWAAAKATCNLPNKFWYNKFSHQLIDKFGKEHFRSRELLNFSDRCKN